MEQKIPNHLGLILDGNRRWAKKRGLPMSIGHREGLKNLEKIGDYVFKKGVKILTVYLFSYENWKRTEKEVNFLMKLLISSLSDKEIKKIHKKGIKINIIGNIEKLSKEAFKRIENAEKITENNKEGIINFAVSYSGRMEILSAIKKIIKDKIDIEKIKEELFETYLYTHNIPSVDLIIRTGGEHRLSNFLTWQSAYAELYFSDKLWPSFSEKDIDIAFDNYSKRERRFGK